MAMVKFTKLKLKALEEVEAFEFNGEVVEVKQYLPYLEKVKLVSRVVTQSLAGRIVRDDLLEYYFGLELVFQYTNISFTDNQKNDLELFDKLDSNGLIDTVIEHIPESEYEDLIGYVNDYAGKLQEMSYQMVSGYSAQTEAAKDVFGTLLSNDILDIFSEDK